MSRFLLTNSLADIFLDILPTWVVYVATAGQKPLDEPDLSDLAADQFFRTGSLEVGFEGP